MSRPKRPASTPNPPRKRIKPSEPALDTENEEITVSARKSKSKVRGMFQIANLLSFDTDGRSPRSIYITSARAAGRKVWSLVK